MHRNSARILTKLWLPTSLLYLIYKQVYLVVFTFHYDYENDDDTWKHNISAYFGITLHMYAFKKSKNKILVKFLRNTFFKFVALIFVSYRGRDLDLRGIYIFLKACYLRNT